ncbi:hypothetical protein BDV95DRAFT_462535, partial [Massariosphaeria phaeospora]
QNPPTMMASVTASSVLLLTITTCFVAARAYVKVCLTRKQYIEDYFSYVAWVLFCGGTSVFAAGAHAGLARHLWDVPRAQMPSILKFIYALFIVNFLCQLFAKLSILFQIKRIFTTRHREMLWWLTWGSILFNIVCASGLVVITIFQCDPVQKSWYASLPGSCLPQTYKAHGGAIYNIVSDGGALLLPIIGVWNLQMDTRRKLGVVAIFGVGSI